MADKSWLVTGQTGFPDKIIKNGVWETLNTAGMDN